MITIIHHQKPASTTPTWHLASGPTCPKGVAQEVSHQAGGASCAGSWLGLRYKVVAPKIAELGYGVTTRYGRYRLLTSQQQQQQWTAILSRADLQPRDEMDEVQCYETWNLVVVQRVVLRWITTYAKGGTCVFVWTLHILIVHIQWHKKLGACWIIELMASSATVFFAITIPPLI